MPPRRRRPARSTRSCCSARGPAAIRRRSRCPKLFIVARDDVDGTGQKRLPGIQTSFDASPQPKQLLVLEGSAHAQFLFATPDESKVLAAILRFLPKPERRPR